MEPIVIDPARADAAAGAPAPRVLVLDADAPGAHLVALARRLGAGAPGGPEVVLLAATGGPQRPELDLLPAAGRIAKPIVAASLLETLAAVLADTAPQAVTAEASRPLRARAHRRILLAEDNLVNRRVARGFLERAGHEVVAVDDGRAAVAALARESFDLVLMDVEMPVMDGLEAMRVLRAGGARLPIVALTAQAMAGDAERCLAAGADAYLAKPFDPRELFAVIDRLAPPPPGTRSLVLTPVAAARPRTFDEADLLARVAGDRALLAEVIQLFLAEGPRLRAELAAVVDGADPDPVARIAHRIKGMLASLSARPASALARELEERARRGEIAGLHEHAERLDQAVRAVEAELATHGGKA
jgi:CheY-like chemotaxis protein/HPt (histidine-containing phosphotransfer) domain-containing protein